MKKFFSSENPYRDLIYISTAVIFILGIVLYKSSLPQNADLADVEVSESEDSNKVSTSTEPTSDDSEKNMNEKNQMNLQTFRDLTASAQEKLPTRAQIKKLSAADVHHTPDLIREAGLILSQIAQALHDNENLASEAASFYESCYSRVDLPTSIRGLCMANHRNIRLKWGDRAEWTSHEAQQPAEVLRLAEAIPQS
jgi:hypothetical protein